MRISYKAVYHLMDRYYARWSLETFIMKNFPQDVFRASILFARKEEDYRYLDVMLNKREELEQEYIIFTNIRQTSPIILKKDTDLSLLELAILSTHCDIHQTEFSDLIVAACENMQVEPAENVAHFNGILGILEKVSETVDKKEN